MGACVQITREDHNAADLHRVVAKSDDAAQMRELHDIVVAGPDPERDQVVRRWRRVDLGEEVARRFSVVVNERSANSHAS